MYVCNVGLWPMLPKKKLLYVSYSGSITSVVEERADLSAIVCGFCSERFPLPLGAWDGLCYFIVALSVPSI